jgi:hypothetical protein
MTVDEIITRALKIINVIDASESLTSDESGDGLLHINGIIDEWNIDKFKSYSQQYITGTLNQNQSSYTVGAGGDINGNRPVRIEGVYVTNGTTDYKLNKLSFDEYNAISNKVDSSSIPTAYYYNPSIPTGTLYLYPAPSTSNTITITQWYKFGSYTTGSDSVDLPAGFNELLTYKLAVEMCSYFSKQVPVDVFNKMNKLEDKISSLVSGDWIPSIQTITPASCISGYTNNNNPWF